MLSMEIENRVQHTSRCVCVDCGDQVKRYTVRVRVRRNVAWPDGTVFYYCELQWCVRR